MVKVHPKLHRKYVIKLKQGVPMLYFKLAKDIYGILYSAMLFYKKLRSHLEEIGFEIDPHYPCVASMKIHIFQNDCLLGC